MGKKGKTKSCKKSNVKRSARSASKALASDTKTLVSHAETALSQMQIENALGYYEQALSIDNLNSTIMDSLADIYLSLGESDRAFELLQQSAQVSPEDNPGKYLYIAQMQQGDDALSSYNLALHYLSVLRQSMKETAVVVVDKQIIKSLCGIAELYLTDLCYNNNAEQECDNAITQALGIDPNSVDAKHALANFRLSQNKSLDASVLVEDVFRRIHEIRGRINARTVIEDLHAPEHTDFSECIDEPDIPSLEICVSTVKMMLECASIKPKLAEDALEFSAELLNDDDENVELWYIAGVAAMSTAPPDFSVALHYFTHAKSMIDDLKELPNFEDGAMDEHYSLIVDHISMIESQQQGQSYLAANSAVQASTSHCNTHMQVVTAAPEEWSSSDDEDRDGEEEDGSGGGRMDI